MIRPITGAVNGVGVKFRKLDPCPSTKIQVRMPSVDPRVSALITAALIGSTTDPNTRNINSVVVVSRMTIISGNLWNSDEMESCSSAGTPPTDSDTPWGSGMARNSSIFLAASLRTSSPFCNTVTSSRVFSAVAFGLSGSGATARSVHSSALKPGICAAREAI